MPAAKFDVHHCYDSICPVTYSCNPYGEPLLEL